MNDKLIAMKAYTIFHKNLWQGNYDCEDNNYIKQRDNAVMQGLIDAGIELYVGKECLEFHFGNNVIPITSWLLHGYFDKYHQQRYRQLLSAL